MKLYTEEQVIQMIEKSRETGLTAEYLILANKGIELPSDEEIGIIAMGLYGFKATSVKDVLEYKAFQRGAKMVINKIQGGNK